MNKHHHDLNCTSLLVSHVPMYTHNLSMTHKYIRSLILSSLMHQNPLRSLDGLLVTLVDLKLLNQKFWYYHRKFWANWCSRVWATILRKARILAPSLEFPVQVWLKPNNCWRSLTTISDRQIISKIGEINKLLTHMHLLLTYFHMYWILSVLQDIHLKYMGIW
jgi:hypothetical protein